MENIYFYLLGLVTTPVWWFLSVKTTEVAIGKTRRVVWEKDQL